MEERLSPAAATTAEEAMASSGDRQERGPLPASSRDIPVQAPTGREEAAPEGEPWAAAVPPVRNEPNMWGLQRKRWWSLCAMCSLGVGPYHQTRHAVSEEDQSPAPTVGRLPARDACQEEKGGLRVSLLIRQGPLSSGVPLQPVQTSKM